MTKPIKLRVIHGEVYASSLDIAERFGVQHKNVLQAIRDRLRRLKSQPSTAEFADRHFVESTYQNAQNHVQKMYLLDEAGFYLSAFLFKTPDALFWHGQFIESYIAMRNELFEKAVDKIRWRFADEQLLPFGTDSVRKALPTSYVAAWCRVRCLPDMTTSKLNDLVKAEKIEGRFIPLKSVVYADAMRDYLGSLGIYVSPEELGGNGNAELSQG